MLILHILVMVILPLALCQIADEDGDGKKEEHEKKCDHHCHYPELINADKNKLNVSYDYHPASDKGECRAVVNCNGITKAKLEGVPEPVLYCMVPFFGVTCSNDSTSVTHQGRKVLEIRCEPRVGPLKFPRFSAKSNATHIASPCAPGDAKISKP